MAYYYHPFWNVQHFLFYDIPLFLLMFGLFMIITKFVVRIRDPILSTAIPAFAASAAYFVVRNNYAISRWFYNSWQGVFGIIVIAVVFGMAYFTIRYG